ncbi:unnamed protein product [Prunus brigantina]
MTIIVAKAIGAILGEVLWVDNRDGTYCVGHFIRIRLRFDVTQRLIRRTPNFSASHSLKGDCGRPKKGEGSRCVFIKTHA